MRSRSNVAHYEVEELLGRGGMGEVYRARDTRLERFVALKFLSADHVKSPDAKERFIREAKSASALEHPNICTIHDFGETEDGELYMVMAFYEGRTLEERLGDGEAFPPERTERILRQLAHALTRAHQAGIIHRDLKPANVMVGHDDAVRLLDFGIAKLQSEQTMTRTGSTLGTASWMSPEQAAGDPVTAATDIWSLGVIGYRLLTGRLPFEAENPLARLNQILTFDPPRVRELSPECPSHLADAVEAALEKEPTARPADGAAFLERLGGAAGTLRTMATGSGAAQSARESVAKRRIVRWAMAGVAALVVGGVGWGLASGSFDQLGGPPGVGAPESTADVLAVLPFSVSGAPEFDYLAEGLMDLLAGRLDGAGPIRAVDTRAIVAGLNLGAGEGVGAEQGAELARKFGAGSFVSGQLVGLPGRVSMSARIHVIETGEQRDMVTIEGSADSLFILVDRLASGLLETSITGQNARIAQRAAATSNSLPATRAFLEGEQFHRSGQFDSAAAAYNRAVAIDSTFALAYLMKSINNAYTYETDDLEAAERAMRFSEGLPERDRSIISAFLDQQNGELRKAEERYLNHLRRWPDEVKAMSQIGRLYSRGNLRLGLSLDPATTWLERVLEYEPESIQARHTLARVDAIERRFDRVAEHRRVVARVAPGTEWDVQLSTMADFALNDSAAIAGMLATYTELPLVERLYAVYHALLFASDPGISDQLLAAGTASESMGTDLGIAGADYSTEEAERLSDYTILQFVLNDIVQGRHDEVRDFLVDETRPGFASPAWILWEAEVLVSDVVSVDPPLLERMLGRLDRVDPTTRMDLHFERLHDVFTPAVAELERNAARARILIRLGRLDEARTIHRRIINGPSYRGFASLREDVARAIEAELLLASGDEAGALETLRRIEFQVSSTANALPITHGTHARALRAELEMRLGDPTAARHLWEAIAGGPSPDDKRYLSVAYERLGRLAEAAGDREAAIYWTDRFVRFRRGADPEFRPETERAEARLAALRETADR